MIELSWISPGNVFSKVSSFKLTKIIGPEKFLLYSFEHQTIPPTFDSTHPHLIHCIDTKTRYIAIAEAFSNIFRWSERADYKLQLK